MSAFDHGPTGNQRLRALFIALTILLATSPVLAAAPAAPNIQTLSLPTSSHNGPMQWRGSGFYVNEQGAVLTAAHVVADCAQLVLVKDGVQIRPTEVRVEQNADLAVLQTPRIHGVAAVFAEQPPSSFGVSVASFIDLIQTPVRSPVLTNAMILDGDAKPVPPKPGQFAMISMVQPGASGSAVLDSDGRVVGMVQSRTMPGDGANMAHSTFAVGLDPLASFLRAAQAPFRQSREPQLEPEQSRRDRAASFTLGVYCQQ